MDIAVFKYGRTTYFHPQFNGLQPVNYRKVSHYIRMFIHFKNQMHKLMDQTTIKPEYPFTNVEKQLGSKVTGFYYSNTLQAGVFQLSNGHSVYQDENMTWCTLPERPTVSS